MDIFSFDINMEEYEEIDYYLRPSRKNRRVLGICFAVISTLSIILAITEYRAVTDGYYYQDSIFSFTVNAAWAVIVLRIISIFAGAGGYFLMNPYYWTAASMCCVLSFIFTLLSQFLGLTINSNMINMVVAMLVIIAEICLIVLSFLVFIAFIYQIRVKENDSKMSLQLNDPEAVIMRNLFASMYSLVPGLTYLTGFMSSSTKSE
ncbi:uncharacterized protein [Blastocystis hominis]|uniref:Uncharacterized protein n=1 Tax=Blastocystis hominis TaxID=12968 RepID=D8MAI8_BLAHO|nr:uncharacterized protein [Blastocystis hominis]CBK25077.2 unnamed protein product [Blastocystis hominis]|eukprot:XP_012899125.1 uncharacterized protein [Blastocystis hominis]